MFWAFPLYASFPLRYASWEYACKRLWDIMSQRGLGTKIDHIKPQKKITPNQERDTLDLPKGHVQNSGCCRTDSETIKLLQ